MRFFSSGFLKRAQVFLRSAAVGAAATLADLSALFLLVQVAGVTAALANVPALLLGVAAQFVGNRQFAFRDQARRGRALAVQGGQFLLVEAGALGLNALFFELIVARTKVPYLLARLVSSALVYAGYSFPLWNRIFRREVAAC